MEYLGKFIVRTIKVTQESVDNIVLLSCKPLGVFLYAPFKEEGGVMSCRLDVGLHLDKVRALPNYLPEVGLAEPAR
jgi:hypothetical protein